MRRRPLLKKTLERLDYGAVHSLHCLVSRLFGGIKRFVIVKMEIKSTLGLMAEDSAIRRAVAMRMLGGSNHPPGAVTNTVINPLERAQLFDDAISSPAASWAEGWRYADGWKQYYAAK